MALRSNAQIEKRLEAHQNGGDDGENADDKLQGAIGRLLQRGEGTGAYDRCDDRSRMPMR
jgi:hypothetical protein